MEFNVSVSYMPEAGPACCDSSLGLSLSWTTCGTGQVDFKSDGDSSCGC